MMRTALRAPGGKALRPDTLRRVVRCFKPYRRTVLWTFAAVLVSVVLGLLPPWFLQIIIDKGLQRGRLDITADFSIYTILATLAGSALTMYYGYLSVIVGQRIMVDLRNQLYQHLQGMSLRFFTGTRTGEIQSRLISDVSGVQSVVSDTAANALSNLATVLSTFVAMIYFDWRLTLLTIVVVPLFAVFGQRIGVYARSVRKGTQEQTAELNAFMQETLSVSGVLLTKTSGRRSMVVQKFEKENESLSKWQIRAQMIMYVFMGMIRLITSIVPATVYWLAAYLIARGNSGITIGTLVAFTALQGRMFFPLTSLMNVQVEVSGALALFDRIFEYLDLKQEIVDAPDAIGLEPSQIQGRVEFRDVSFRYDADSAEPTLEGIDFVAEPGQLVALVGPSGAGKTTLTYLIPRLYDVDGGVVLIDGRDVRHIALESIGAFIGAVTQETYLVHASVRENLLYAKPDATDEELAAACRAAAIYDHIANLPEGFDTVVGERGYKLSGGEKQRLAIARAVLKNPRILILDEATSALDTHSERLIQSALGTLMVGRTTFAIAHRLSTILKADLILVLQNGRIIERGRHDELIALEGAYAQLYRDQFEEGQQSVVAGAEK